MTLPVSNSDSPNEDWRDVFSDSIKEIDRLKEKTATLDALLCARFKRTVKVEKEIRERAASMEKNCAVTVRVSQLRAWARMLGVPVPTKQTPMLTGKRRATSLPD